MDVWYGHKNRLITYSMMIYKRINLDIRKNGTSCPSEKGKFNSITFDIIEYF